MYTMYIGRYREKLHNYLSVCVSTNPIATEQHMQPK